MSQAESQLTRSENTQAIQDHAPAANAHMMDIHEKLRDDASSKPDKSSPLVGAPSSEQTKESGQSQQQQLQKLGFPGTEIDHTSAAASTKPSDCLDKTTDGVAFLQATLAQVWCQNGRNEVTKDELKATAEIAEHDGNTRTAKALEFAVDNFDQLKTLSAVGDVTFDHNNINGPDLYQLPNYDSYLRTGKWQTDNPLLSDDALAKWHAVGSGIGAVAEAASFLTPAGPAITAIGAGGLGASMGAGIGLGKAIYDNVSNTDAEFEKNSLHLTGNATKDRAMSVPVFTGVGALEGEAEGIFWGPAIGYHAADFLARTTAEKVWNYRHRDDFESMYAKMRQL